MADRAWWRVGGVAALALAAWLVWTLLAFFLPAVTVPGYEQALVASLLAPPLLGPPLLALARRIRLVRPLEAALTLVAVGALLGALPALWTGALGAITQRLCGTGSALAHVVLGPVSSGALLGASAWLAVSLREGGRRAGLWLLLMVLLSGADTLWRLYEHPQAFALDHYFGHFRGPIYEEGSGSLERVVALRVMTVALASLMVAVAGALHVTRRRGAPTAGWALGVVVALAVVVVTAGQTAELRRPGREEIQRELRVVHRTPHAVIRMSDGVDASSRARVALEVERHIEGLRTLLGVPGEAPITVYLYASAEQKARLLGAGNTLLAKPWTREIHVQGGAPPIAALRHELAHVLAGDLTTGPFKVSAILGVLPRVMLIEGMATALEEYRGDLTLEQQAALMLKMGRLPSLERLLGPLGFFVESGARAYSAAGAFLRFVAARHGNDMLAAVYRAGTLSPLGVDVGELERAWHEELRAVTLPERGLSQSQRVFSRGSLLERRCVDRAADLWETAHEAADAGRMDDAEAAWRALLELDAKDDAPLRALLEAAARQGDDERVRSVADELMARPLDPPTRAQVLSQRADAASRAGELEDALRLYDEALTHAEGAAQVRALRILRLAVSVLHDEGETGCGAGARGMLAFLVGKGPEKARGRSDLLALERARVGVPLEEEACGGRARMVRGTLHYLIGRQLVADDPQRADGELRTALELGLPDPTVVRETMRLLGEAGERRMKFDDAARFYEAYAQSATTDGEKAEALAAVKRAAYAREHAHEEWARAQ
ncbi:MAG: hypothetical protein AB2A00_42210 [Myxococcota bacterium]